MGAECFQAFDTQTVPPGETTYPSLEVEIDTASFWTSGSRLTFPANGLYFVALWSGKSGTADFGTGGRIIYNGSTVVPCGVLTTGVASNQSVSGTAGMYLYFIGTFKAGDYIEFQAEQDELTPTEFVFGFMSATRLPTDNCFVANTIVPVLVHDTWTAMSLPADVFTFGGWTHDTTTAVVPTTGNYLIFARFDTVPLIGGTTGDHLGVDVLVNGVSLGPQSETDDWSGHFYTLRPLTAGDEITWNGITERALGTNTIASGISIVEIPGPCVNAHALGPGGQAVPNGSYDAIDYDAEYVDTDGFHVNVGDPAREKITIPGGLGGYYLVLAREEFLTVDRGQCWFQKNGAGFVDAITDYLWADVSTNETWVGAMRVMNLADGDFIKHLVESNSLGSTIDSTSYGPEFIAIRLNDFTYASVDVDAVLTCPFIPTSSVAGQIYRRQLR